LVISRFFSSSKKPHRTHQLFYFSYKTANRIVKRWFAEAGVPKEKAHFHTLRHTFVLQSFNAGVPLNYICEQTGDTATTVVEYYARPSIDDRLQMMNKKAYWKEPSRGETEET
jgi:integrase